MELARTAATGALLGAVAAVAVSSLKGKREEIGSDLEYLEQDPALRDCIIYLKPFQEYDPSGFRALAELSDQMVRTYADCLRLAGQGATAQALSKQHEMEGTLRRLTESCEALKVSCGAKRMLPQDATFLHEQLEQLMSLGESYMNNIMVDASDSLRRD